MIRYRDGVDVLELLSRSGFTAYQLRKQHVFGERTIEKFRKGGLPSWQELNVVCDITGLQVGELIEHCREDENPQGGV